MSDTNLEKVVFPLIYTKNLTEDLRLRLSQTDMDFLRSLSEERSVSVSEVIRSIIGEYRRSLDTLNALKHVVSLADLKNLGSKEEGLSNGDTKTDINRQL